MDVVDSVVEEEDQAAGEDSTRAVATEEATEAVVVGGLPLIRKREVRLPLRSTRKPWSMVLWITMI